MRFPESETVNYAHGFLLMKRMFLEEKKSAQDGSGFSANRHRYLRTSRVANCGRGAELFRRESWGIEQKTLRNHFSPIRFPLRISVTSHTALDRQGTAALTNAAQPCRRRHQARKNTSASPDRPANPPGTHSSRVRHTYVTAYALAISTPSAGNNGSNLDLPRPAPALTARVRLVWILPEPEAAMPSSFRAFTSSLSGRKRNPHG
jgi:hypothetical protein